VNLFREINDNQELNSCFCISDNILKLVCSNYEYNKRPIDGACNDYLLFKTTVSRN